MTASVGGGGPGSGGTAAFDGWQLPLSLSRPSAPMIPVSVILSSIFVLVVPGFCAASPTATVSNGTLRGVALGGFAQEGHSLCQTALKNMC